LGGISWATLVGLIAYFLGHSASNAIESFGLFGLVAALLAAVSFVVVHRRHRARSKRGDEDQGEARGQAPVETGGEAPGEGEPPS
jgi:membrane protein DedA with SNARE-associated domain